MANSRVAVVAGGSGGIGEGIVSVLLTDGYRVYVPTRAGDHSERLRSYVGDREELQLIEADLGSEQAVMELKDKIVAAEGQIDAVIVSVGADYYGHRMHRMPIADWDRSVRDNLLTHFNTQRVFVDQLRKQDSGVYVTLIGPEAESIRPDAGVMSIMAAAQKMMTRVIAHESFDSNIRVHTLTAHTTIKTRTRGEDANHDWITATDLGSYLCALVDGSIPGARDTMHELQDRAHVQKLLKRIKRV